MFDFAREHDVGTVLMGYGGTRFAGGRAEGPIEEFAHDLPCDFLVLEDREFDTDEVLLPTAGGYSSDLSAEVARALRDTVGSNVSVLYVADDEEDGRAFLADWAADHGLEDAELLVETGDVEAAIEAAAADRSLVIVGATERGLLQRLVSGSLALAVFEDLDSVLLAERPTVRSLRERLFG